MKQILLISVLLASATTAVAQEKPYELYQEIKGAIYDGNKGATERLLTQHPELINVPLERNPGAKGSFADGYPPLHYAIANGHKPEIVKMLLEKGASPAVVCRDGSAMHIAAFYATPQIIKMLLEKGADVNGGSKAPAVTPLQLALLRPNEDNMKLLVERGAKLDVYSAAGLGKLDLLKMALKESPRAATQPSEGDVTALHFAAACGQVEAAKLLLEAKSNPSACGKRPEIWPLFDPTLTPLHLAADRGHADMVELLIKHGADIEARKFLGQTPIFEAHDPNVISVLVKAGAKIDEHDFLGFTPLHHAIFDGNTSLVKVLLAAKADPNVPKGPSHLRHLHIPSAPDDPILSVGYSNFEGQTTPLHLAAEGGEVEIIRILIKAGAKLNTQNTDWKTPLDVAVARDKEDAAKVLRENGAKEGKKKE